MNQKWWQSKHIWALGLFGGLLNIIQPIIGVLSWPFYQPTAHVLAVLVAKDQPKHLIFNSINIVVTISLLIFSWALVQYYMNQHEKIIQQKLKQFMFAFVLIQFIRWELPVLKLVDVSQTTGLYFGYLFVMLIIMLGMGYLYWKIGQALQVVGQTSFANMWQLSGALMVVFEIVIVLTQFIGWPLAGLFDQLVNFLLVYPLMFNSWHFGKATN